MFLQVIAVEPPDRKKLYTGVTVAVIQQQTTPVLAVGAGRTHKGVYLLNLLGVD